MSATVKSMSLICATPALPGFLTWTIGYRASWFENNGPTAQISDQASPKLLDSSQITVSITTVRPSPKTGSPATVLMFTTLRILNPCDIDYSVVIYAPSWTTLVKYDTATYIPLTTGSTINANSVVRELDPLESKSKPWLINMLIWHPVNLKILHTILLNVEIKANCPSFKVQVPNKLTVSLSEGSFPYTNVLPLKMLEVYIEKWVRIVSIYSWIVVAIRYVPLRK
ncbi:hypothetical protein N431DRAFT_450501 [Stipitochalara longipes BDJ]|nr:hypothetical protein N431DRAFT_450501 [Stipitochalara longipes BDJ]